jgi:hypothetical protein
MDGVLDEAFARFSRTGPEFGPGLSNHGPMASEALVALGRGDAVPRWANWYASRLQDSPRPHNPIAPGEWREALGDVRRAADWSEFFALEVARAPWDEVLETWTSRLTPGIIAGATHGVLRTAHAVRALGRGETPARLKELAQGLAYWAARYQELPAAPAPPLRLPIDDALARVPRIDAGVRRPGLIFDAVRAVETVDFAPVISYVDADDGVDADGFLDDVTRVFVRQYLANAGHAAIAFIHTVTAPAALRGLAPHLTRGTLRAALRHLWQACAAIYSTYGGMDLPQLEEIALPDRDDLVDQAVAARDEHAIKFTEACLREYARSRDPAFIAAARDVVVRLRVDS